MHVNPGMDRLEHLVDLNDHDAGQHDLGGEPPFRDKWNPVTTVASLDTVTKPMIASRIA
jgi:hypothetical protein